MTNNAASSLLKNTKIMTEETIVGIIESRNNVDWTFSFLAEYIVRAFGFPNIESIWAMPAIPKK